MCCDARRFSFVAVLLTLSWRFLLILATEKTIHQAHKYKLQTNSGVQSFFRIERRRKL